jgi:hypothetical protein
MFTHPALLRELNLISDLLRRGGEGQWSRRIVQAADGLRKAGWTPAGAELIRDLRRGEPGLMQLSFGAEHLRFVGGAAGLAKANERLDLHRRKLEDLMALPTRQAQPGPRPKSPDLAP